MEQCVNWNLVIPTAWECCKYGAQTVMVCFSEKIFFGRTVILLLLCSDYYYCKLCLISFLFFFLYFLNFFDKTVKDTEIFFFGSGEGGYL